MIRVKTEEEIKMMKQGGRILSQILKKLSKEVKPGVTTRSLEEKARRLIDEAGAEPAFLGFNGYPAVLCVSINEEIVHCLPSERKINSGDLVSLDLGIKFKEFNVDSATTVLIEPEESNVTLEFKKKLIKITKECLDEGVEAAKVGNTIGGISYAIQNHAEENGFSVIRDLVGHGIGRELHEEPEVPNFGVPGRGVILQEGMTIAIEPMLTTGRPEVKENKKTLAWETKDKSLAAHFEHTVAITKNGPLVLTE